MRSSAIILALLLAACQGEKSFDDRYADRLHEIRASGEVIDAEMVARASEAAQAEAVSR